MPRAFAAAARDRVRRAIRHFGDGARITVRRTVSVLDPVTEVQTPTTTEETAYAVFVGVTETLINTAVPQNQTLRLTDKRVFIPVQDLSFTPDDNTKIIHQGVTYKVIEGTPLQPGDDIIYHDLFVREVGSE